MESVQRAAVPKRLPAAPFRVRFAIRMADEKVVPLPAPQLLLEFGLPVMAAEIPLLEAYVTGFGLLPPEGHRYGKLLDELLTAERVAA